MKVDIKYVVALLICLIYIILLFVNDKYAGIYATLLSILNLSITMYHTNLLYKATNMTHIVQNIKAD